MSSSRWRAHVCISQSPNAPVGIAPMPAMSIGEILPPIDENHLAWRGGAEQQQHDHVCGFLAAVMSKFDIKYCFHWRVIMALRSAWNALYQYSTALYRHVK